MAKAGEHILFFSLEQSKFELVAKSISRETFIADYKKAKTSLEIMQNTEIADITIEAYKNYQETATNITIIEGNFNITVNTIRENIDEYIEFTGIKPIVVIDYLQIIRPLNERMTDKQQVDVNITELKRISRDFDIPIFVVCSFNRENYTKEVSYEAFKESGAIEYSADVVMGLQLAIMEKLDGKQKENRDLINKAKDEIPRKVQLIGLKNRNGRAFFKCNYEYYSPFNYFKESKDDFDNSSSF